ncbi:MAG: sigma-E factor negative regulatory protein [Azoarcus sp.]|nr:sigma-E factor negative regulatory protein [Azoarcus sp.]
MQEKLSAMLDGEVDDATVRTLLTRLKTDKAFRDEWDAYCLLGDIIKGYAPPELEGFTERVMDRLESEPTILVPSGRKNMAGTGAALHSWRHRLLPLAASVMGVLTVGGVVAVLSDDAPAPAVISAQVAETPEAASVAQNSGPRHDYLLAHQAMAGGPMPMAVQYVRTVSTPSEEKDK